MKMGDLSFEVYDVILMIVVWCVLFEWKLCVLEQINMNFSKQYNDYIGEKQKNYCEAC